ncbi:MAG: hypothetical protein V4510_06845 [bacterium]
MTPLPPAPPSGQAPSGIPQRRRKSSIRTATESVQEQFLDRVRQVAKDPTLALPEPLGEEAGPLRRLRRSFEAGKLPFSARFDKGLLGALRAVRDIATQDEAPRMLDARVDGNRRFFLTRGHVNKLCCLGVQNWDDPLALMLAYGPIAIKHHLHLFAGSDLWCSGTKPAPPAQWFRDLAERTDLDLAVDGQGAACPHADRPRVSLDFRQGPSILVCGACGHGARNLHTHLTNRYVCDQPSRPVDVRVVLAGGGTAPVGDGLVAAYRVGKIDEAELLGSALKAWHKEARSAGRFAVAGRDFGTDQDAFLDALALSPWEREAVRRITAGGHVGAHSAAADVLADHRDTLATGVEAILPGEGEAFVRSHAGTEARSLLRLAHDEAERRSKTRDLPAIAAGLGPLGQWIDGFAREARTLERAQLLANVRRLIPQSRHPAHLYAFLCAIGLEAEGERSFNHEQKEAGAHWAPLAKSVMAATGDAYRDAVLSYLRETGAGETA